MGRPVLCTVPAVTCVLFGVLIVGYFRRTVGERRTEMQNEKGDKMGPT